MGKITNELLNAIVGGKPTPPSEVNVEIGGQSFSPADRAAIEWQYFRPTGWKRALWDLISQSDMGNLARLELGFPTEVGGYRAWCHGDLAQRLRAAADNFEGAHAKV